MKHFDFYKAFTQEKIKRNIEDLNYIKKDLEEKLFELNNETKEDLFIPDNPLHYPKYKNIISLRELSKLNPCPGEFYFINPIYFLYLDDIDEPDRIEEIKIITEDDIKNDFDFSYSFALIHDIDVNGLYDFQISEYDYETDIVKIEFATDTGSYNFTAKYVMQNTFIYNEDLEEVE